MRRVMPAVLVLVFVSAGAVLADGAAIIPAINLPYGANINTEVLLTDNDLLGVVKEGIPGFVQLMGKMGGPQGMPADKVAAMATDVRDALANVSAVRFLAVQYPRGLSVKTLAEQLNVEARKSGEFTRLISHVSEKDSVVAVYAAADKGGYLGYYYDVKNRSLMAARIVGFLDVAKLTNAATQAVDSFGVGALGSIFGPATTPPDSGTMVDPTTEDGTAAPCDEGVTAPSPDDNPTTDSTGAGDQPAPEPGTAE